MASETETRIIDLAGWINEITGNKAGVVFKPEEIGIELLREGPLLRRLGEFLGTSLRLI